MPDRRIDAYLCSTGSFFRWHIPTVVSKIHGNGPHWKRIPKKEVMKNRKAPDKMCERGNVSIYTN